MTQCLVRNDPHASLNSHEGSAASYTFHDTTKSDAFQLVPRFTYFDDPDKSAKLLLKKVKSKYFPEPLAGNFCQPLVRFNNFGRCYIQLSSQQLRTTGARLLRQAHGLPHPSGCRNEFLDNQLSDDELKRFPATSWQEHNALLVRAVHAAMSYVLEDYVPSNKLPLPDGICISCPRVEYYREYPIRCTPSVQFEAMVAAITHTLETRPTELVVPTREQFDLREADNPELVSVWRLFRGERGEQTVLVCYMKGSRFRVEWRKIKSPLSTIALALGLSDRTLLITDIRAQLEVTTRRHLLEILNRWGREADTVLAEIEKNLSIPIWIVDHQELYAAMATFALRGLGTDRKLEILMEHVGELPCSYVPAPLKTSRVGREVLKKLSDPIDGILVKHERVKGSSEWYELRPDWREVAIARRLKTGPSSHQRRIKRTGRKLTSRLSENSSEVLEGLMAELHTHQLADLIPFNPAQYRCLSQMPSLQQTFSRYPQVRGRA